MGWFAVDDGFDNHPKIRKAGNAAAGLFCRLGAYATRHNTEGQIPGPVARDYGTAAQIRKLGELDMLHARGHNCRDCRQPEDGSFLMHDFLDYNRSKQEVKDAKEAGAERQRRRRARLAAEAAAAASAAETAPPSARPGATPPATPGGPSPATPPEGSVSDMHRWSEGSVTADPAGERARPTQPIPVVPPLEEQQLQLVGQTVAPSFIGDRPRIPAASQPLVDKLTAAGMVVGWDLQPTEWFLIEALIKRCGIDALVVSATGSWQGAKKQPRSGSYFLPAWRNVPDAVAPQQPSLLPAVGGQVHAFPNPAQHRAATSDARATQALEAGRRIQAQMDARRAQETS